MEKATNSSVFRSFLVLILLPLFCGIFLTFLYFVVRGYGLDTNHADLIFESDTTSLYEMTSNFGSVEYECHGTCFCEVKEEFRRGLGSARVSKPISTFLVAVSSLLAYRIAKNEFEDECYQSMSSEECKDGTIQSNVEGCVDEFRSSDLNDESKEGDGGVCSITDAIFGRRSVRDYTKERVPQDVVKKIIEVGNYAPSGKNVQPLRYYLCEDQAKLKDMSRECLKNMGRPKLQRSIFYNAPLVIFITNKDGVPNDIDLVGSCCIGRTSYCKEYIAEVMGFGEGEIFTCALIVGYPNPERKLKTPKRKEAFIDWKFTDYEEE